MKLFLLSQNSNTGYDTFDSCVVIAESEEIARTITPSYGSSGWVHFSVVTVEYLGEAKEDSTQGLVLASFNAG